MGAGGALGGYGALGAAIGNLGNSGSGKATTGLGGLFPNGFGQNGSQPYSMTQTDVNGRNMVTTNMGQQADGKPNYAPFESMRDASGNLNSKFKLQGGGAVGLDQSALNKMKSEMMGDGLTSYGQAQMNLVNNNAQDRINSANVGAANGYQTGLSNMMMTGGLDAGSRERMNIASNRQAINGTMGAMGDATSQRLGVMADDAKNKINGMSAIHQMGMDNYNVGAKERDYNDSINKFNIGQQIGDLNAFNNYNMNNYNEQIRAWANAKVAAAQSQAANEAAKPKGFLSSITSGLF